MVPAKQKWVGVHVGASIGTAVGASVGVAVGSSVGVAVGAAVEVFGGALVGACAETWRSVVVNHCHNDALHGLH